MNLDLFRKLKFLITIPSYFISEKVKNLIWRLKFWIRKHKTNYTNSPKNILLNEVTVRYINLKSRTDRNISMMREFKEIGFVKFKRIPGVPLLNGALGCAMAHVNAIQDYLVSEENILMICEDDIIFDSNFKAIQELLDEFILNKNLDILCIGNNVLSAPVRISEKLSIANNIQTASCYVVKRNVVPELLSTFIRSIERMKNGEDSRQAAIDIQWKKMQQNRIFAFPNEKIAIQGASFSNIENTYVDYKN